MTRLHSTVRRFVHPLPMFLALLFAILCSVQALASPVLLSSYRVTIDTSALAGKSGYVDFLMLGLGSAAPVQASVGHFSGAYAPDGFVAGDASGSVASGVTIGNGAAWNEFAQWASLGGLFTFDVSFSTLDGAGDGTNLGISLLDENFNYLGAAGDLVTFALQPGVQTAVTVQGGVASVSDTAAVPEPATMLLVAVGLALLSFARRRRMLTAT